MTARALIFVPEHQVSRISVFYSDNNIILSLYVYGQSGPKDSELETYTVTNKVYPAPVIHESRNTHRNCYDIVGQFLFLVYLLSHNRARAREMKCFGR